MSEGKKECKGFEPQTWRRNMCKNCFKSRTDHESKRRPISPVIGAQEFSGEDRFESERPESDALSKTAADKKQNDTRKHDKNKPQESQKAEDNKTGAKNKTSSVGGPLSKEKSTKKSIEEQATSWQSLLSECEAQTTSKPVITDKNATDNNDLSKSRGCGTKVHASQISSNTSATSPPPSAPTTTTSKTQNQSGSGLPTGIQQNNKSLGINPPQSRGGLSDNTASGDQQKRNATATGKHSRPVGSSNSLDKNTQRPDLAKDSHSLGNIAHHSSAPSPTKAYIPPITQPSNSSNKKSEEEKLEPNSTQDNNIHSAQLSPTANPADTSNTNKSFDSHLDTVGRRHHGQTEDISDNKLNSNDVKLKDKITDKNDDDTLKLHHDPSFWEGDSTNENRNSRKQPSPLSPVATEFSQVFDPPLSPKSLDKYRKELFASDENVPSPKSPTTRFTLTNNESTEQPVYDRYSGINDTRSDLSSLIDYDPLQGRTLTIYHTDPGSDLNTYPPSGTRSRNRKSSSRRRRSRGDFEDDFIPSMAERTRAELGVSREEAMMEGTRMLMENLREKITFLEDRCNKMEREKSALTDLLSFKKSEHANMKSHYKARVQDLEDDLRRTTVEKERLLDRLKLPESERGSIREMEVECAKMNKKMEETENRYFEIMDENMGLRQEVKDLHLEMEEIHDQFREDEQIEFRELQKELEINAKNCRILQFKLRKSERRNEQIEADKMQLEEKVRQLESRFESRDDKQHLRELEEELKMAKEVSVRLHDELELVEEKRGRYEEELDRVNDMLTDSENSRASLQKEIDRLNAEIDTLRTSPPTGKDSLSVRDERKLGSRQSSTEYGDVAQIMRDLQDSLERQQDLQDQLSFAEEEAHTLRKKIAELEQENESVTLQLAKVSAAKSGKFSKKSGLEQEVVTEREHELRLQMELAEQELKVLRRKMDEMQTLNETLIKELKRFERQLMQLEHKDKRSLSESEEEQMRSMAMDIEKLKWRLIEQDQEAAVQKRRGRLALKKSKSLEEEPTSKGSEYQQDLRRQLETIQQEAGVLRDKLTQLEKENERLVQESKRHDLMKGRTPKVPSIKIDDAAQQNIELQNRVKRLEEENQTLKAQIKSLDERTSKLSKEVTRSLSGSQSECLDYAESRGLRSQVRTLEEECGTLRKKVRDIEHRNNKLTKELEEKKAKKAKKEKKEKDKEKEKDRDAIKMSKEEMRSKILSQESEIRDLKSFLVNRDEENTKLEAEVEEYREDLDKILDAFKKRERELMDEIEMLENKNSVISNLLEIVTERAESTQKELYKSVRDRSRSPSAVSDMSGVSAGSDEVFATSEKVIDKDWEEQFGKRIDSLERLLAEEKQKLHSAEKKLLMREETQKNQEESKKIQSKEIQVIQQELTLAQGQLKEANKKLKDHKHKAKDELEEKTKDLHSKLKQAEEELKKLKDEKEKEEKQKSKQSASWIWEKNELDRQLKESKKKVEDLHAEVKKQQFKWKMAGEDIEREQKQKVAVQEQLQQLKESEDKYKRQMKEFDAKITKAEREKDEIAADLEREKKAYERKLKKIEQEIANKDEVIKSKDEILKQKEEILSQKSKVIEQSDAKIKQFENEIKTHLSAIQRHSRELGECQAELSDNKSQVKDLQTQIKDRDKKIRTQNDELRSRDTRLKEKDDILQELDRKLTDRENEVKDMDKTIRSVMKKLQDKEFDVKTTEKTCQEFEKQAAEFRNSNKELKSKLKKLETDSEKEIKELKEARDKYSSDLAKLTREKKTLMADLQKAKESLSKENEQLKKEVSKLDLELKQAKEKLHSIRTTGHMRESDAVRTLEKEKDSLISEKHKLNDQLNTIRRELQDESRKWKSEREDLQKIIQEKTRLIDTNSTMCDTMQKEITKLKQQVGSSHKTTPIPVQHVSSSGAGSDSQDLLNKIQTQDLMHQAEKIGLEELYEGKVKNLQEQVNQSEKYVTGLRRENDDQLDLIKSSRKALADLRQKYDQGVVTWNAERKELMGKIRQIEDDRDKKKTIEKDLEAMKAKYLKEEAKRKEAENKLAAVKTTTNTNVPSKAKKEEKTATSRPVGKVSDFRAKFETFGTTTSSRRPSLTRTPSITEEGNEDGLKLIKNLQDQIKDVEKTRDKERQEYLKKLEEKEKDWEKETKRLKDKAAKLDAKLKELDEVKQSLVKAQYESHEQQEKWSLERHHILSELESTRKMYVEEKGRITDIIAEVKKLQALSGDATNGNNGNTKVVFSRPVEARRQISEDKVLQHISKLVEVYEKAPPLKSTDYLNTAPPTFKRSLSSSDVEVSDAIGRSTHTSTSDHLYESATLGRVRGRQGKTTGIITKYTSGSQSAYGSRDQSPDKSLLLSRRSNLPKAPPSMIISPSHTPKRDKSVERNRASFSEREMQQLYEKLGEIEHTGFERGRTRAIEKERRGLRVLTKSMSVDNPKEDVIIYRNGNHSISETPPTRTKRYAAIAKIHSGLFDDAPLSSTLPASIVIGELVITPGAANLTRKARKVSKHREESQSPKSVRRHFFDQYTSPSTKSYFSWPKRGRTKSTSSNVEKPVTTYESDSDLESGDHETISRTSSYSNEEGKHKTDHTPRTAKRSIMSSLFKTVKEKKIFRRSKSVDSSPISSTVVRAGLGTLSPAAPSTYQPPLVPYVEPTSSLLSSSSSKTTSKSRKPGKFQRAASVDAPTLLAVTPQAHSSVVSSIIAHREAKFSSASSKQEPSWKSSSPESQSSTLGTGLNFERSASERWRNNPSFRLATNEKPVVMKRETENDERPYPKIRIRRHYSTGTLHSQTRV